MCSYIQKKYFVNIQEGLKHFFKYIAFKFSCAWIFRRHLFMLRKLKQRYIEIWILKVNSVQEVCGKCFAVHVLKFEILQITWKNQTKNIRLLVFSFSSILLAFWCFLFCFFMWFARFKILICEPQSIWCKLLVLSWLYYKCGHAILNATLMWTKCVPSIYLSSPIS